MPTDYLTADVVETKSGFTEMLRRNEAKYMGNFENYEQYTLFMMLPLSSAKRDECLAKMRQEKQESYINKKRKKHEEVSN